MNSDKYVIISREMNYTTDNGDMDYQYQIGKDKRTSSIAIINIDEVDEVLYNVMKISCDSLGQYSGGIKKTLLEYYVDSKYCFMFNRESIRIEAADIGYAVIMWTLLDRRVKVNKNGETGIIETRKEDLYFI